MNPMLRSVRTSRTPGLAATSSAVRSGEASSTTTTSNGTAGRCASTLTRHARV